MSELSKRELEAIVAVHEQWLKEEVAGNSTHVLDLCTDDVTWLPPATVPLVGKKAISRWLKETTTNIIDLQVTAPEIEGSDSLAFLRSDYHCRYAVEAPPELRDARGTHLWILRKSTAGEWRVAVVTWNRWDGAS